MRRLATWGLALAILALAIGAWAARASRAREALARDAAGESSPSQARGSDSAVEAAATTLDLVRATPGRFLGQRLRFVLQLQGQQESWNPYATRFGAGDWAALAAWPDERFTWDAEVHRDPATHLFVRRGSALASLVAAAEPYERFEAVGVVRALFLDQPWIELETLAPLPGRVGEGTILTVSRAKERMAEGSHELALELLERAQSAPLPEHASAEIRRLAEECRRALER
jgi:hypothetical protein